MTAYISDGKWDEFSHQTKITQALIFLAEVHSVRGLSAFKKTIVRLKAATAVLAIEKSSYAWAFV
jgi:hypothetical protein